jgi:hypothetical protein
MYDDTTLRNGNNDLDGEANKAKVSRRTFSALVGAGVALLLPRGGYARDVAEGDVGVQASDSRRQGEAMRNPTGSNIIIKKFSPPRPAKDLDHAIVYRRDDEFASHPYTSGFWETAAGHLIANFATRKVNYGGDPNNLAHTNLGRNPGGRGVTVRSEDRGRTWKEMESANDRGARQAPAPADRQFDSLAELGPIDFTNKDVLIANSGGFTPTSRASVRVSKDAGRTWSRSFLLPLDGLQALGAMNSSMVRPDGRVLLFMFEVSKDGWNRHPLVYRSTDDGTTFHFMSFITPKDDPFAAGTGNWTDLPFAFGGHRWFYPRGYMLPNGRILCVLRSQRDPTSVMWTEVYKSDDGGQTWGFLSRVNDFGAPGSLVRMDDGRLVMVYGYRVPPFGVRAAVSEDEGLTWGPEMIVRDDGGSWDLGYPNAWNAGPGKVGVLYYINTKDDPIQVKPGGSLAGAGGVRHIARSFFSV